MACLCSVRDVMAGRVEVAANFKRDSIEYDHQPRPGEFIITDQS